MIHFKLSEFDCNCGCGKNNMQEVTLNRIDLARDVAGIAFTVSSGTRCWYWNFLEGGKEDSSHLTGYGVDIEITHSRQRIKTRKGMMFAGFNRIGTGRSFLHCDDDPGKPPEVEWLY